MNKKTIITALLVLVAMAVQAQTQKAAIVKGYSPALEDSTVVNISRIGAGNRFCDLGFQESDLDGTHDGIGFQESRQERIKVWSDFRNPSRKRTRFGRISRI